MCIMLITYYNLVSNCSKYYIIVGMIMIIVFYVSVCDPQPTCIFRYFDIKLYSYFLNYHT